MFSHLQIAEPRERLIVGIADLVLSLGAAIGRVLPARRAPAAPRRILLLRLERIGDLLMTLDAIETIRAGAPGAELDLVVGSWNEPIARLIPGVRRLETLDVPWLARDAAGAGPAALFRAALAWRRRRYDLGLNFEGDIRSNMLLALSGAARRAGFESGGGGALLHVRLAVDPAEHVSARTTRLARAAIASPAAPAMLDGEAPHARLALDDQVRTRAARLLDAAGDPVIGVHASGGREVKQWDPDRFAELARRLARERGASIVLTGSRDDRPLVSRVEAGLAGAPSVLNLAGEIDLPTLAAVLERLDVFVTGDTGPMHLAAAVGTPIVALFGPSDPARYAPAGVARRVLRVDLPCSPCNRIRRPPERCRGRVPECLEAVGVDDAFRAVDELLRNLQADDARRRDGTGGRVS